VVVVRRLRMMMRMLRLAVPDVARLAAGRMRSSGR
jgi:hypothetical protein